MANRDPVRVLIVDDHALFADALRHLLDRAEEIDCVGVAYDSDAAVDLALAGEAEVVLMDITLTPNDGFHAARRLLEIRRAAKVIALTGREESEVHDSLVACGMVGYLSKDRVSETVVAAILNAAGRDAAAP